MYRDNLGRFAIKPVAPVSVSPSYHSQRDAKGRFAPKPPVWPKADSKGILRFQNGKFAPKPSTFKGISNITAKPAVHNGYVTLTVADVIAAIEKNGAPQTKSWGKFGSDGKLISGCALAQGAYNLGLEETSLYTSLDHVGRKIGSTIIAMNDAKSLTIPQIVAEARSKYSNYLNRTIVVKAK
jgi:hypothetical protein